MAPLLPRLLRTHTAPRRAVAVLAFAAASPCVHAAAAPAPHCRVRPASPPCQRARAAEAQARQEPEPPPPPLERATLRVQLGLGGGALGIAARIGAEASYWVWPQLSVGATASLLADAQLLHGDEYERVLYAAVVTVRTRPSWIYAFASAAAGYANVNSSAFEGESVGTKSRGDLGVTAALGFMGHMGWHELGASVVTDLLTRRFPERNVVPYTITINVVLGLFL
jgi:hypothetical protein